MPLYLIRSFAIYSVNMNLCVYYVMTFLIIQKGHHSENENNSAVRLYRQALGGFLTITTESVQTQGLAKKKVYIPLVRNSLQSEVCINHLAVTVVIWKSSVFYIVLLYFRSAIPCLLPNIRRISLFFHKNIVCLIKKASVFVNESKTSGCFLFFKIA